VACRWHAVELEGERIADFTDPRFARGVGLVHGRELHPHQFFPQPRRAVSANQWFVVFFVGIVQFIRAGASDRAPVNLLHIDALSNFEQLRQPRKDWCSLWPKRSKVV
jgi:hypothetical protein